MILLLGDKDDEVHWLFYKLINVLWIMGPKSQLTVNIFWLLMLWFSAKLITKCDIEQKGARCLPLCISKICAALLILHFIIKMTLNGNDFYSTPIPKRTWSMPIFSLQYQKTVLRTQKMKKKNMVRQLINDTTYYCYSKQTLFSSGIFTSQNYVYWWHKINMNITGSIIICDATQSFHLIDMTILRCFIMLF